MELILLKKRKSYVISANNRFNNIDKTEPKTYKINSQCKKDKNMKSLKLNVA